MTFSTLKTNDAAWDRTADAKTCSKQAALAQQAREAATGAQHTRHRTSALPKSHFTCRIRRKNARFNQAPSL